MAVDPQAYRGIGITLITHVGLRYTGILQDIDPAQGTINLSHVKCCGSEGRMMDPAREVQASPAVYNSICFRASDINDLNVTTDDPGASAPPAPAFVDPAIVTVGHTENKIPETMTQIFASPSSVTKHPVAPVRQEFSQMPRFGQTNGRAAPAAFEPQDGAGMSHPTPPQAPATNFSSTRGHDQTQSGNRFANDARMSGPAPRAQAPARVAVQPQRTARGGRGIFVPDEAFDFEQSNLKLRKAEIIKEFIKMGVPTSGADVAGSTGAGTNGAAQNDTDDARAKGPAKSRDFYNSDTSFFDNISCDALERQANRDGRATHMRYSEERKLNAQTFGVATAGNQHRGNFGPSGNGARGFGNGRGGFGGNNRDTGGFGGINRETGGFGSNNRDTGGFGGNHRDTGGFGGNNRDTGGFGGNNRRGGFGDGNRENGFNGNNRGGFGGAGRGGGFSGNNRGGGFGNGRGGFGGGAERRDGFANDRQGNRGGGFGNGARGGGFGGRGGFGNRGGGFGGRNGDF